MVWTTCQLNRLWMCARLATSLGLLSVALAVRAIQLEAPDDSELLNRPSLSAPALADNTNSTSPDSDTHIGGLNTNFSQKGDFGSLSIRGGMYFNQKPSPLNASDATTKPLDPRFDGRQVVNSPGEMLGFSSRPGHANEMFSDQLTSQQLSYQANGFTLTGNIAKVGKNFQGLDSLVKQMAPSNPDGAKQLELGKSKMNLGMSYTGIRGLNFSTNINNVDNSQQGSQEFGLTRTNSTSSLGLALGQTKLEYSISNLMERWDPLASQNLNHDVQTQALRFSGKLGAKSQFSLGQTLTDTTLGTTQTNLTQRDMSLQWNEWKNCNLQGNYHSDFTQQTGQRNSTLNLNLAAMLTPKLQLTGNFMNSLAETASGSLPAGRMRNDLLDLKLAGNLLPSLTFSSDYQRLNNPTQGSTHIYDQQFAWQFAPRWKLTTHYMDSASALLGQNQSFEYGVSGDMGSKTTPQQLSLLTRSENLPNNVHQDRTEMVYSLPLLMGKNPLTMQVRAGTYGLTSGSSDMKRDLLTMQMLGAKLTPSTTLSLGYYMGPMLGTNYLTYRSWGAKPVANTTAWTPQDFADYQEFGGEVTQQIGKNTKLALKAYHGQTTGIGPQSTMEYGIEQHFGTLSLLAGYRSTVGSTAITPSPQHENWWRVTLPSKQQLPDWAKNSLHASVFDDSALWGINQAPAWTVPPVAGLTVEKHEIQVGSGLVNSSTLQACGLLGKHIYLQSSFEENPAMPDLPNGYNPEKRGIAHVGIQLNAKTQLFARYMLEQQVGQPSTLYTQSVGLVSQFAERTRLQFQIDLLRRCLNGGTSNGLAYMLEFERTLQENDSLVLKYRLCPREFNTMTDHVGFELDFRHAF